MLILTFPFLATETVIGVESLVLNAIKLKLLILTGKVHNLTVPVCEFSERIQKQGTLEKKP